MIGYLNAFGMYTVMSAVPVPLILLVGRARQQLRRRINLASSRACDHSVRRKIRPLHEGTQTLFERLFVGGLCQFVQLARSNRLVGVP